MALRQASGGFAYTHGQWATGWVVNVTDSNYDGISDLVLYRSSDGAYARATVSGPGQFVYDYGNVGTGWTVLATSPIWP
jgi:hypothetical protein